MAYIGNDVDAIFIPSSVNTSTDLRINGGALTQTGGDVNLDGGTFFLDESANRVGIGTITPGVTLDVVGTIRATNINALDLSVEDKNIVIGDVASPTNTTADGGGITLKGAVDKTIAWLNATAAWTFSEHVNIASAKEYRIAGTKVLDATSLGSAVVSSSLTSVGTIATGVWNGSVIGKVYLDATVVSTGDTGTVTSTMILNDTILDADINASAGIVDTKLATIATAGKVSNSATTATNANTASAIVARDESGNFSAGTITAALTGAASSNVLKAGDTMTGALVVPLGAFGTPSLTFTGDLNTGIFSPGADQLAVATNGTKRLQVDAGGNVSIDAVTDTGPKPLSIYSQARDCEIRLTTNSGTENNVYLTLRQSGGKLDIYSTNGDIALNPGNSLAATFKSDGKVGIGASSPNTRLEVASSISTVPAAEDFTTTVGYFNNTYNNGTNGTTAYTILRLRRDGVPGTTYGNSVDFGLARYEAVNTSSRSRLDIRLGHGLTNTTDTTVMTLLSSGAVGIGTIAPRALLDIGGNAAFNAGTFQSPKLAVSNGYISIKSDAADGVSRLTLIGDSSTGDGTIDWGGNISSALKFSNNGTERLRITSTGTVNIVGAGTAGSTQAVSFSGTAPVNSLVLDSSGRVGIGTASPTSNLHVVGSTELSKLNLSGISSSISSTAVDVFVYDTRKDSDGGAWRKRTQSTSWYNETLNTATRGARKEFPAVAVIVATNFIVTIYDGDDPDMPMWMVFDGTIPYVSFVGYAPGSRAHSAVTALNGRMVTCSNGAGYAASANFISDDGIFYNTTVNGGIFKITDPIIKRNSGSVTSLSNTNINTTGILDATCNDVAMTVLPNAPIDPSTSLPVPTIAVATAGGVSIIKDDGSVVDITGQTEPPYRITFNKSNPNEIITSGYWTRVMKIYNIPASDVGEGTQLRYYVDSETPKLPFGGGALNFESSQTQELFVSVSGGTPANGFYKIAENLQSKLNGMTAYIRTDCNTGWMHGDIKGAWLSDTSTASVTGTELVTNGTFDSNVTGWTANTSTNTWSSGTMQITRSGGFGLASYQSFTTVAGQRYVASATINSSGSRGDLFIINGTGWGGTQIGGTIGTNGQTLTLTSYFTAISTTTTIGFGVDNNETSIFVDNVSVRREEPDRSVNNKGLAVYGTITKTAVATGSNLVAYGGFSVSNYLVQPYNSALDFGTGDFCYMCWVKDDSVSSGAVIFQRGAAVNSNETVFYIAGDLRLIGRVQTLSDTITTNICFVESAWNHCVFLRKSGTIQIYHNGILQGSATNTETMNQSGYELSIGSWRTNNSYFPTSISLFRVSASAPSPSQILKIYNDEKMLFQENSQATLYGASDAVTALAYDDTTDLLSVGTSSGRSDFSGLKRINNTTTAVTTAISASNGLIAEQ